MLHTVAKWLSPGRDFRQRSNADRGAEPEPNNDLERGLTAWAHRNMAECLRRRLTTLDITTLDGASLFLSKIEPTRPEIEQLGQRVKIQGCARSYVEVYQQLGANHKKWIYKDTAADWRMINATVTEAVCSSGAQYQKGPLGNGNSCAMDCALVMANQLDAGRLRADSIQLARLCQLHAPSFMLRYVMSLDLASIRQYQWNALRDIMLDVMFQLDEKLYKQGAWHPFNTTFQEILQGLPQVTLVEVQSQVCCDKRLLTTSKEGRYINNLYYKIDDERQTLETTLNRRFGLEVCETAQRDCSLGSKCTRQLKSRRHIVLGRMPPRLIVGMTSPKMTVDQAKRMGCLAPMNLVCFTTQGTTTTHYVPVGAVFLVNGNHFTCRWKRSDESILHYDAGRFTSVTSFEYNYRHVILDTMIFEATLDKTE